MSTPVEYTDAIASLKSFRNRIFEELVSGRVKASLDAGHDCMQKYGNLVDGLSVTPYLFDNVKQKALALKLGTRDVNSGEIWQAKANYVLGTTSYPLGLEPKVAKRNLPQVDVFRYEIAKDIDLLTRTETSSLSSVILLQSKLHVFAENPSAENTLYNYYEMCPCSIIRGDLTLNSVDPYWSGITTLRGDWVYLYRELHKASDLTKIVIYLYLSIEPELRSDTEHKSLAQVVVVPKMITPIDDVFFNICGSRIPSNSTDVWVTHNDPNYYPANKDDYRQQLFSPCSDYTWHLAPTEKWKNHFKVMLTVNNIAFGTTNPVPAVYDEEALTMFTVVAQPSGGHSFDHWELDGIEVGTGLTINQVVFRESELRAIFV